MAIADTETLAITDTDPQRTVMAHELLYALIAGYGLYGRATLNKIDFVDNMLAALSTPFAAFYVDLAKRTTVKMTLKDMIRTALECHVEQEFEFSSIPNGKIVGRHVAGRNWGYTMRKPGPIDKECNAEFHKLVDLAVDLCVAHLDTIRAYWADRKVRMVETSLVCITTPRKPGDGRTTTPTTPQVDLHTLRLPLEAIPVPALQKVTTGTSFSSTSSSAAATSSASSSATSSATSSASSSASSSATSSASSSSAQPAAASTTTVYQPTPEERAEVSNLFGASSLAAVKGCLISHVLAEPAVWPMLIPADGHTLLDSHQAKLVVFKE
jgi:hypothetical protein